MALPSVEQAEQLQQRILAGENWGPLYQEWVENNQDCADLTPKQFRDRVRKLLVKHGKWLPLSRSELSRRGAAVVNAKDKTAVDGEDTPVADDKPPSLTDVLAKRVELAKAQVNKDIYEQLLRERTKVEIVKEALVNCIQALPPVEWLPPTITAHRTGSQDIVVTISDTQLGQFMTKAMTGGLAAYDEVIFEQRLRNLFTKITQIVEKEARDTAIRTIRIWFLGDMVDNNRIFPGHHNHVNMHIMKQVILCVRKFVEFVRWVVSLGYPVEWEGIMGNHGRTVGKKGEDALTENFDWLAYQIIDMMLASDPRVTCHISESWFSLVEVYDKLFYLHHGDDIASWMGLPAYGMIRYDMKMYNLLQQAIGKGYDYSVMGDKHQAVTLQRVRGEQFANGAWPGMSVFSGQKMQAGNEPRQWIFGVKPVVGVDWRYNYLLDVAE